MANADALTADEVAKMLRVSRNTVYNLVKRDELASYYVGRKMRFSLADVENYIARSQVIPASGAPGSSMPEGAGTRSAKGVGTSGTSGSSEARTASPASASGVYAPAASADAAPFRIFGNAQLTSFVLAGNDVVGDMMANFLGASAQAGGFALERLYEGSYAAADVYTGHAHAALVHMRDADGSYNVEFVRHIIPGTPLRLVRLVRRRQGFIVARGNPKNLRVWEDLGREGVRLANRERGCGSRVLLDEMLLEHGIDRAALAGYGREHPSALTAATLVARGAADVTIGSERVFHQVEGVDFIPLQDEWLDVVLSLDERTLPAVEAVCQLVRTRAFRDEVSRIPGYDVSHMGKVVFEQ